MHSAIRRVVAVLLACALAILIVTLLDHIASQVTMPPGVDPTNGDQVKNALEHGEFPFASLALSFCGWLLAGYAGARVALGLSRDRAAVLVFTVFVTLLVLHELNRLPYPRWMWFGGLLGTPLVALGATGENITLRTR